MENNKEDKDKKEDRFTYYSDEGLKVLSEEDIISGFDDEEDTNIKKSEDEDTTIKKDYKSWL